MSCVKCGALQFLLHSIFCVFLHLHPKLRMLQLQILQGKYADSLYYTPIRVIRTGVLLWTVASDNSRSSC